MVITLLQALRGGFTRGTTAGPKQSPLVDLEKIISISEASITQLKAQNAFLLEKLDLHLDKHQKVLLLLEDWLKALLSHSLQSSASCGFGVI
ncbi:MAG: hypothetical protein FPO08_00290 [Geobacter sp.]|nr:MAG: hypothetical protein FPO08_00290 [Geobacter sp.]